MGLPIRQVVNLQQLISYRENQIASRNLANAASMDIVLYAMASAESISNESSPSNKIIYVVDGQLIITINRQAFVVNEGDLLVIDKNRDHSIEAPVSCKFVQINDMDQ
ncbi:Cupin domain protein [compost metagenome]